MSSEHSISTSSASGGVLRRAWRIGLGVATVLVACDKSPTYPNLANPNYPARLELSGPASIPPGGTGQFLVRGFYPDGSQEDLTSQASWRSGRTSVLTIDANGLATGRAFGETSITASFRGRTATKTDVVVTPAGTFRLSGVVRDAGEPVVQAQVTVVSGPAQGLNTITDGSYKLYGVVGDSEIRVTKAGYDEATRRITVSSHQVLDFDLTLMNPRDDVAGTYTLTITAAPECASKLPAEVLSRSYQAVLTQDRARLTVKLAGATFFKSPARVSDQFSGTVEPHRVTFRINEGYAYYGTLYEIPDLFEEVAQSLLGIGGLAVTTASPRGRSGLLDGTFAIYDGGYRQHQACRSAAHRFELTR